MSWRERIESDPRTVHGKPRVRGIPVSVVLDNLATHVDVREVLASYPSLSEEDVRACVAWAAEVSKERDGVVEADFDPSPEPGPATEVSARALPEGQTLMDVLLSMPDVGEDADFERPVSYGRPDVDLS
jgi:uncharacterized protein (DUF433 family)